MTVFGTVHTQDKSNAGGDKTFSIPKTCCKGDPQLEHETPLAHRDMSEIAGLGIRRIAWVCSHWKEEGHEAPALNELFWARL